jgi:hypothetical protein
VQEDLKAGLAKGGRQRSDIEFNMWLFVAPNDDRKQSIEDARATVAFYGGVAQYEEYFAAHGFRNEARQLQEGVQRGDYLSVKHLVTDEMARTFVVGQRRRRQVEASGPRRTVPPRSPVG